jgi:hypothetical protein
MTASTSLGRLFSMPYALLLPLAPLTILLVLGFLPSMPAYRIPEQFPFWIFFFGLPHIVSSFQTMCDTEYLLAYRKQAVIILGLVFLPLALHAAGVPASLLMAIVLILTQQHVVAQQYGMALAVARARPTAAFAVCKWSTLTLGVLATFLTYTATELEGTVHFAVLAALADSVAAPLLALIVASGGLLVWRARGNRAGALIFTMNVLLFTFALILIFHTSYALVGLMLVRILHDVSGFVVYIGHDAARNKGQRRNLLYRLIPFLPIWTLNLLFAIALAAAMSWFANRLAWVGWLVTGVTVAHYFMESVIWRGPTMHRRHFKFTST